MATNNGGGTVFSSVFGSSTDERRLIGHDDEEFADISTPQQQLGLYSDTRQKQVCA